MRGKGPPTRGVDLSEGKTSPQIYSWAKMGRNQRFKKVGGQDYHKASVKKRRNHRRSPQEGKVEGRADKLVIAKREGDRKLAPYADMKGGKGGLLTKPETKPLICRVSKTKLSNGFGLGWAGPPRWTKKAEFVGEKLGSPGSQKGETDSGQADGGS